jgi:hypothetical protein
VIEVGARIAVAVAICATLMVLGRIIFDVCVILLDRWVDHVPKDEPKQEPVYRDIQL